MIGSASTARCSGRTVTQPPTERPDAASHAKSADPRRATLGKRRTLRPLRSAFGLKVDTKTSFVHLGVAIRVFREEREVVDLEAHQDAKSQRQEEAAPCPRGPNRLFVQHELIGVRKRRQRAETDGR